MKKNLWQPPIDNWIINENSVDNFASSPNMKFGSGDAMAGGSHFPIPVKQEEEEEHDNLEQPYKGISKFTELKEKIQKSLEHAYGMSKVKKDEMIQGNPYDVILQILKDPELIGMLEAASHENKKRNLTSF